jgi:hypothetical protein
MQKMNSLKELLKVLSVNVSYNEIVEMSCGTRGRIRESFIGIT